jgi:hypothetical protein
VSRTRPAAQKAAWAKGGGKDLLNGGKVQRKSP